MTLPRVALHPGPPGISRCEAEDPEELPDDAPLGVPRRNNVTLETVIETLILGEYHIFVYHFVFVLFQKMLP